MWAGTPFTKVPLLKDFGYLAIRRNTRKVMEGTYKVPVGADHHATKLLKLLKMDKKIRKAPRVSMVLTTDECIAGWSKAREVMSFGPSGYHFGHTKVVCKNCLLANEESTMTNILYTLGYSPQRWWQGTNCMLEKSSGNQHDDKL